MNTDNRTTGAPVNVQRTKSLPNNKANRDVEQVECNCGAKAQLAKMTYHYKTGGEAFDALRSCLVTLTDENSTLTEKLEQLKNMDSQEGHLKEKLAQNTELTEALQEQLRLLGENEALKSLETRMGMDLFRAHLVPLTKLIIGGAAAAYFYSNPETIINLIGWENFETAADMLKFEQLDHVINACAVALSYYIGGHALSFSLMGLAIICKFILDIPSAIVAEAKMFADDTLSSAKDLVAAVQFFADAIAQSLMGLALLGYEHKGVSLALLVILGTAFTAHAKQEFLLDEQNHEAVKEFLKPVFDTVSSLRTSGMEYLSIA